jgi:hypothetical protein
MRCYPMRLQRNLRRAQFEILQLLARASAHDHKHGGSLPVLARPSPGRLLFEARRSAYVTSKQNRFSSHKCSSIHPNAAHSGQLIEINEYQFEFVVENANTKRQTFLLHCHNELHMDGGWIASLAYRGT